MLKINDQHRESYGDKAKAGSARGSASKPFCASGSAGVHGFVREGPKFSGGLRSSWSLFSTSIFDLHVLQILIPEPILRFVGFDQGPETKRSFRFHFLQRHLLDIISDCIAVA